MFPILPPACSPSCLPREAVRDVACDSIATGQSVFSGEVSSVNRGKAISWMQSVGMLSEGYVSSQFTTLKTMFKQPVLHSSCDSRFSIRRILIDQGWTAVDNATEASLESARFNSTAPLEYFLLIRHHHEQLVGYDGKYGFRHSQSKGYYDTLLVCFREKHILDLEQQYVAHAQKLEFYKSLKDYFAGRQCKILSQPASSHNYYWCCYVQA